jgi:hypothetical protein
VASAKTTDFKAERFLVMELAALDVVAVKSIFHELSVPLSHQALSLTVRVQNPLEPPPSNVESGDSGRKAPVNGA